MDSKLEMFLIKNGLDNDIVKAVDKKLINSYRIVHQMQNKENLKFEINYYLGVIKPIRLVLNKIK